MTDPRQIAKRLMFEIERQAAETAHLRRQLELAQRRELRAWELTRWAWIAALAMMAVTVWIWALAPIVRRVTVAL